MVAGSGKNRTSGFFRKSLETMPRRGRADFLNRKLRDIIGYAYKHTIAFKEILDTTGMKPEKIQRLTDLERIPVTKKADLIELQEKKPPFGGWEGIPVRELRRIYVSPGPIHEPGEKDYDELGWAQAMIAGGFRPGDLVINTFSYHMVPFAMNMLDNSLSRIGCITVPTGVGNTEQQVQILKRLKVTGFCGTPSFLLAIAQKARELGLTPEKDLSLRVGLVAAEMLPESLRSQLEETFGMILRQSYGTADIGCLGYECLEKNGMHVPDDKLVEIVDPETGRQLKPGEVGEVVATTFNKVYPLIRFGTGDLSSVATGPCRCGRTSPRLTKILGRIDQATKVRGLFIHPGQVDALVSRHPEIGTCQAVVTRREHKDEMTFRIELKEGATERPPTKEEIERTIRDVMKVRGDVEFVPTGSIPQGAKKIDDQRTWE